jgi:molybdate transport system ATP-binding protein
MTIAARFRVHRGDFKLDVDLRLPAQGVTALFGPSGCGKTTLLRAIAGLDHHHDGALQVAGTTWQTHDRFVPAHQRSVGFVFQEASLFAHLDVRRNLEYGWKRVPEAERKLSLPRVIELLDITPLLSRKPATLSGGERQRVAIARALAVSPRLLLMDEPLVALDLNRKQEILPYIEALHHELDIPLIYVSHSPDEVARLADYLVLLDAGRVVASGDIHDLFTRLDLPLAQEPEAAAVIEAVVASHDEHFQLTQLDFAGGRFTIPRELKNIGEPVRLRLAARDVSLTLHHQSDTSILNIFPATVDTISAYGAAQVTVRLLAAGLPILARVTRKSAVALALEPGRMVYAQAKSVALLS